MKESIKIKIKSKERAMASLTDDYHRLDEAFIREKDPEMKASYQDRRDSKLAEIEKLEEELQELESTKQESIYELESTKQESIYSPVKFKDDLPKIDFREVKNDVQQVLESFEEGQRGDALFLLQNNTQMEGDLFIQILKDLLKEKTGDFKPYRIGTYSGSSPGFESFVEELSRQLPPKSDDDRLSPEQNNVQMIANSVGNGSIIFLEIHGWDCLEDSSQEMELNQFIQKFWLPLVEFLKDNKKYPEVKFVAILVADGEFKCNQSCFNKWEAMRDLFFWQRLSLRNWTEDEIQKWLVRYLQYDKQTSVLLARRIFNGSTVKSDDKEVKGIPSMVRRGLENALLLN